MTQLRESMAYIDQGTNHRLNCHDSFLKIEKTVPADKTKQKNKKLSNFYLSIPAVPRVSKCTEIFGKQQRDELTNKKGFLRWKYSVKWHIFIISYVKWYLLWRDLTFESKGNKAGEWNKSIFKNQCPIMLQNINYCFYMNPLFIPFVIFTRWPHVFLSFFSVYEIINSTEELRRSIYSRSRNSQQGIISKSSQSWQQQKQVCSCEFTTPHGQHQPYASHVDRHPQQALMPLLFAHSLLLWLLRIAPRASAWLTQILQM